MSIRQRFRKQRLLPQRYGGVVTIAPVRNRSEAGSCFCITYQSPNGEIGWVSKTTELEDHAEAGARVLAEFLGAIVSRRA